MAATKKGSNDIDYKTLLSITIDTIKNHFPVLDKYRQKGIAVESIMMGIFHEESTFRPWATGRDCSNTTDGQKFAKEPVIVNWMRSTSFNHAIYAGYHRGRGIGQAMGWYHVRGTNSYRYTFKGYEKLDSLYDLSVAVGEDCGTKYHDGAAWPNNPNYGPADTKAVRRGIVFSTLVFAKKVEEQERIRKDPKEILKAAIKGYLGKGKDPNGTSTEQYLALVMGYAAVPSASSASNARGSPTDGSKSSDPSNSTTASASANQSYTASYTCPPSNVPSDVPAHPTSS